MPNEIITIVETTETIVVNETPNQIVEVIQPVTQIVEVVARGPQGPKGDSGNSDIIGYPVLQIGDIENGDVLSFGTNIMAWYNRKQESLTDGGNF